MRYAEAVQPLEQSGMTETRQFTIAATGKAFRNLMDGLYSRKIEAFCREILTNAFDSHCEAGTPDRLFSVHIPTVFDKRLRVRDFGVGMDHEQVMSRYSTLFDSTKDDSDEFVGMLGLGSKSPFAYTDGFSLRCWDGLKVRVYAVNLGEGGVPQISLANTAFSNEPRGVEVTIPVAQQDWMELEAALARVCLGFATPPVMPQRIRKQMEWEGRLSGSGWAVGKCEALGPGFWARQGCVLYPIDKHEVLRVFPEWGRGDKSEKISVVIDFELGELDVSTSRETLSLNEKSRANIEKRIGLFRGELEEELKGEFAGCNTDWEIALRYEEIGAGQLPKGLLEGTSYRQVHFRIKEELAETLRSHRHRHSNYRWAMIELGHHYDHAGTRRDHCGLTYTVTNQSDSYRVKKPRLPSASNRMALVVDDTTNNARVAHWLSKHPSYDKALVLRATSSDIGVPLEWDTPAGVRRKVWRKNITIADLLSMPVVAKMGHPEFLRASTFAEPPKPPRAKYEGPPAGMLLTDDGLENLGPKELKEHGKTTRVLFYSLQKKSLLVPEVGKPARDWRTHTSLDNVNALRSEINRLSGKSDPLLLVRVTPSTEYDKVRHFRLAPTVRQIFLERDDPEFWHGLVMETLWKWFRDQHGEISRDAVLLDHFERSVNPRVRAVARMVRRAEKLAFGTDYNFARHHLEILFSRGDDDLRRKFLSHVRTLDMPCPRWDTDADPESFLSPRWKRFLVRVSQTTRGMSATEKSVYFRHMELAEMEAQRRVGRK